MRRFRWIIPAWLALVVGAWLSVRPRSASAAYYQWLKISAGVGAWLQGAISGSSTSLTMGRYTPTDASTTKWWQHAGSFANSPGPRRNQVMRWGWNLNNGGGREATGVLNGALGDEFEQYYETGGGGKVMERHFVYVSPADVQTRWISFLGSLESPYTTSLYLYSTEIHLGSGVNNNTPASLSIQPAITKLMSPSLLRFINLDDTVGDPSITIQNGTAGNTNRSILKLTSDGQVAAYYKTNFQLWGGSGLTARQLSADGSTISILSPNQNNSMRVDDTLVAFQSGGNDVMAMLSGAIYTSAVLRPNADKTTTRTLGASGGRFGLVAAAMATADWSGISCTADEEGFHTVVVKGSGQASCLTVCMKGSDNNYAKREVYCAP